jgi:hypothetical protein
VTAAGVETFGMETTRPAQAPRWSGVGCGCLVVLVALALVVWLLTTIVRGSADHAVPDSAARSTSLLERVPPAAIYRS